MSESFNCSLLLKSLNFQRTISSALSSYKKTNLSHIVHLFQYLFYFFLPSFSLKSSNIKIWKRYISMIWNEEFLMLERLMDSIFININIVFKILSINLLIIVFSKQDAPNNMQVAPFFILCTYQIKKYRYWNLFLKFYYYWSILEMYWILCDCSELASYLWRIWIKNLMFAYSKVYHLEICKNKRIFLWNLVRCYFGRFLSLWILKVK